MNTKTRIGRVTGALLLAASAGGCEFISPTETNPNSVPTATVDQLFTGIQVNTFFYATGQISRVSAMWTQQMTGTDRQFAIIDTYVHDEETADGEFSTIYTGGGLIDLRAAIAQAEEAGRRAYAGILKIHEAYMFGMAASIFGDIPYSEAATEGIDEPALDPQADVYAAVQTLLDGAIDDLGAGGVGPGGVDFAFGGNTARWLAVAHTLKARYHMHWAESGGNAQYTAALAQAQQGIAEAAGTWRAIFGAATTENNLWFQFMRDRSGYIGAGDHLVPLMVADADPRLPFYFSQAAGAYGARASQLSATGFGAPDYDLPIISCAENFYIQAEALYRLGSEPDARTAGKAALACEEATYGVDLTPQKNDLDAMSGQALFDEIMAQKYVASFLNIDAYNDFKRTCRPAIVQRAGGVPGRLYYGQGERQANTNIPQASQQPARNANDPAGCT
jgi:hypothetical protein